MGITLTIIMILSLTACQQASGETVSEADSAEAGKETALAEIPINLTVFAAASMTETMQKIADMYKNVAPNVSITYNFDSSGTLKIQIEEGAECDIFISAAQKQMDQLDSTKSGDANPEGLDFVEQGTRINLLENKVALVVPDGNPKDIKSFDDMIAKIKSGTILIAMGNDDVPVGQYTQKILTYFGLDRRKLAEGGFVTYGSNVKEVTTQVKEGSVDCGVVYCTDAYSAGLTVIDTATAEMCGQVIYPAAVMNISKNKESAQAFLDYLKTKDCMEVFKSVGFSPAF